MPALYFGLAGLCFGLVDETGGAIQNVEIRKTREKQVAKNAGGETIAKVYFDPSEEISYDLLPTTATCAAAASPGVSLSLTNYAPAAGLIITEETTQTRPNDNYRKFAVKAVVHPLITT